MSRNVQENPAVFPGNLKQINGLIPVAPAPAGKRLN